MPNPGLSRTRPYPFARLRKLFEGIVPAEGKLEPISLGIGEPCHPIPQCIGEAIAQNISLMLYISDIDRKHIYMYTVPVR